MAERALSERWIDELHELRAGGPTTRVPARTRVVEVRVSRGPDDPLFPLEAVLRGLRLSPLMLAIDLLLGRWTKPPKEQTHAEIALYAPGPRAGDLPRAVVDFPVRIADRVDGQGGAVDVRGELGPGHGVVLVLDDGEVVACQYPAEPPPVVGAARRWAYR